MAVIETLSSSFLEAYNSLIGSLPEQLKILPPLFFIAVTITFYSLFVWFFYRFLAKRDVIKLNLQEYNVYKKALLIKICAGLFYLIEFVVIAPIVIFFWFAILTIFLILLAKELEVGTIMLICAALISAIRITSYFNENLSKDLAKLVPFTLLGVAILTPGFLSMETSISRMADIPFFFINAIYYLLFIVGLELILRLLYLPFIVLNPEEEKAEEKKEE